MGQGIKDNESFNEAVSLLVTARNKRTVWEIGTEAYSEAHFATFPTALVEPCVKAGTSERGCCTTCGAPWVRIAEASGGVLGASWHPHDADEWKGHGLRGVRREDMNGYERRTTGWKPSCACLQSPDPALALVLDPFAGSGTVGVVAAKLGRRFVGVELNPSYCAMARERIRREGRLIQPRSMRLGPGFEEAVLF